MKQYTYKYQGGSAAEWNPMLPTYKVELGKDSDGKEWLCLISPTNMMKHLVWNVDFDTADEYWVKRQPEWEGCEDAEEHSSPFLRPEVVYCDYPRWAEMHRIKYHRKTVEYKDINKTITEFVERFGIK